MENEISPIHELVQYRERLDIAFEGIRQLCV